MSSFDYCAQMFAIGRFLPRTLAIRYLRSIYTAKFPDEMLTACVLCQSQEDLGNSCGNLLVVRTEICIGKSLDRIAQLNVEVVEDVLSGSLRTAPTIVSNRLQDIGRGWSNGNGRPLPYASLPEWLDDKPFVGVVSRQGVNLVKDAREFMLYHGILAGMFAQHMTKLKSLDGLEAPVLRVQRELFSTLTKRFNAFVAKTQHEI